VEKLNAVSGIEASFSAQNNNRSIVLIDEIDIRKKMKIFDGG
jgi:hypothetical protein